MRYLTISTISCVCLLSLGVLVGVWWYPKVQPFNLADPLSPVRYYRGFGLTGKRGLFGKNFYRIDVVLTVPEDGWCKIDYRDGCDTHPFIAYYPDGGLRAKGYCTVTYDHLGQPMDLRKIVDARFHSPDGSLSSAVRNGSGVETYWTVDGIKLWEALRDNCQPTKITLWHRDGQLNRTWSPKD